MIYTENKKHNDLKNKIINYLSDDLLKKEYKNVSGKIKCCRQNFVRELTGHCYIASETYYHLSKEELKIFFIKHENSSHWFLKNKLGKIIDLTAGQFTTPVPYEKAIGKFFLTKKPSKRSRILIDRIKNRGGVNDMPLV